MKAHSGSTDTAVPTLNLSARWGSVVSATPLPLFTQVRILIPPIQKAGWIPQPVWTSVKKRSLAPTRFEPPTVQLYPLGCPGPVAHKQYS